MIPTTFLNQMVGQPVVLGQTDCNSMMTQLLDKMHGTDYHNKYTKNITKDLIRKVRARYVLEEVGYTEVNGRTKTGDFLIQPDRFRDNVFFVYSPGNVITALKNNITGSNKVRTMKLEEVGEQMKIYRKMK
jgi:hypothetical protein